MLVFDNVEIGFNYETLEKSKGQSHPIAIEDRTDSENIIGLTLDQAKWLRDNINYMIKKFED